MAACAACHWPSWFVMASSESGALMSTGLLRLPTGRDCSEASVYGSGGEGTPLGVPVALSGTVTRDPANTGWRWPFTSISA